MIATADTLQAACANDIAPMPIATARNGKIVNPLRSM